MKVFRTARGSAGVPAVPAILMQNKEAGPIPNGGTDVTQICKTLGCTADELRKAIILAEARKIRANNAADNAPVAVLLTPEQIKRAADYKRNLAEWERERIKREVRRQILNADRFVPVRPILTAQPEAK